MARRILIVEDNVDSAESLAILFRLDGHEVLTATEGSTAIAVAQAFHPHLVILDIGLPGMSGYEVARHLRQMGCTAQLVAVTGYGQAEDLKQAREAGFDGHYLKPVEPKTLEHLLT